jgi:hypothetical protein
LPPPALQTIELFDFIHAGGVQGVANSRICGSIASASLITGMMWPVSCAVSAKTWVGLLGGPCRSSSVHGIVFELKSLAPIGIRMKDRPIPPEALKSRVMSSR